VRSNSRNFGKCLLVCGTVIGIAAVPAIAGPVKPAKTIQDTLLYSFAGGASDGAYPVSGLVAGSAGNFFGTTEYGGTNDFGTVFELSSNGTETVLYNFAGGASDGALPAASLIADGSGNLYGTTVNGGSGDCSDDGCGTVFEVTPGVGETVLYFFQGGTDGSGPQGNLFMDDAGNLYGTTYAGGSADCEGGCGTVFKLTPNGGGSWTESVIYSFAGGSDGAGPEAGLIQDSSGNFYSTTASGGPSVRCPGGCGTVFELSPGGNGSWSASVIYSFKPPHHGDDGAYPGANLMMDGNGNLFGTTPQGGSRVCGGGCGAIFELSPARNGSWTESLLFKFAAGKHGAFPSGGLIADKSSGLIYGVTAGAGADSCGVVFQLNNTAGVTKTLYSLAGAPHDGCQPYGTLVEDQNGNLYGTTVGGGSSNMGAIFDLKK